MALADIWLKNPEELENKHISQILAFGGKLLTGKESSHNFRAFLSLIPSDYVVRYTEECLNTKFDSNGLVLQDLINEVGSRLGFKVLHGSYKGYNGPRKLDTKHANLKLYCEYEKEISVKL